MPILDRYLETLRAPGAHYLTFTANTPIELLVGTTRRTVSKGVASSDQIMMILGEIVPAEVLMKAEAAPQEFTYPSGIGPVKITVRYVGREIMARVALLGVDPPPTSPMPAVSSAPAAARQVVIDASRHSAALPTALAPSASTPPAATHRSPPQPAQRPRRASSGRPQHIDELFHQMLDFDASDLHLKSDREPFARIHGEVEMLAGRPPLSSAELWDLLLPIMPDRNRQQFEETRDTDFAYEVRGRARMRCNVFKDINGVGAVFRQIPSRILSAKELNLPDAVMRLCNSRKGLVLVTGPTGSGKSTTLAAMIDHINDTRKEHIITIEDPVEFVHQDKSCLINQREVGASTLSFKAALRAALREDPDIVLVGEMRDLETTAIAIETAETGHLVFATLHTNTATSTVDRVINQFPADRQPQIRTMLSESLVGVVSQTLCKKKGGGRVAAYEVLVVSPAVSNLIREEKTFQLPSVMQTSRGLGMQIMNDALFNLVKSGDIEPDEAYARAISKKELALALTRGGYRGSWSQEQG